MHFPTLSLRRALPRRSVLKAAGAVLALPLLDAMFPTTIAAAETTVAAGGTPRRFVGVLTNMGILPEFFFPKKEGPDHDATPYLDILKAHRGAYTAFSGVSLPGVEGGHANERAWLTGAPGVSSGAFRNTVSLDQIMAEEIGSATRFPSLVLMLGHEEMSISYTRSGARMPPIRSPRKLYEMLFAEDTAAAKVAAHARLKQDRSVLDTLRNRTKTLERSVGLRDREQLDQYFTSVRELERRLAATESWVDRSKPKVALTAPSDGHDQNQLIENSAAMYAIIAHALITDSTRVITLCLNTGSCFPKNLPGVTNSCHGLSHHGGRPDAVGEAKVIEQAQFRELAKLLDALRAAKEGGATVLDRTAVLYGTNMGSANAHSNNNLPTLLAGGGFKHVGHLAFDQKKNYPLTNLHLSLLHGMGIDAENFATSTGRMRGLELA